MPPHVTTLVAGLVLMQYGSGPVRGFAVTLTVPYFPPGDERLAAAVRQVAARHAAVLLANHGPVVAAGSLDAAVGAVEELEATAKLFLLLQGQTVRPLDGGRGRGAREPLSAFLTASAGGRSLKNV